MKTILIVEDENKLSTILAKKLNTLGFKTLQASDGKEGLKLLTYNSVDLILLDILMPNMDGHEFLNQLHDKHLNLPVIVLTNLDPVSIPSGVQKVLVKSNTSLEDIVTEILYYLNP